MNARIKATHPPLTVGVIGAGRIGRLHAENLAHRVPDARLTAVADIRAEAAAECAEELGIPAHYGDPRRVIDDPDIQAIALCSSTDTHAALIEEAAGAGKHIFCEKPIDFDLGRIDRALACVERAGVKLQVGFNRRFDHNFRRIKEGVDAGRIGKPQILRVTSRDPAPPPMEYVKASGGIFLDMTIHDFDMARYLMGDVEELYVMGAVLVDPAIGKAGDLDTAVVSLRFAGGALGTIDNSRKAVYGYDQRVEVFGSEGMLAAGNDTPSTVRLSTARAVEEDLPLFFFLERYTESYVDELEAFVRCVLEDEAPPVTGRDGRTAVVMGKAAELSVRERRPVRLEEIGA